MSQGRVITLLVIHTLLDHDKALLLLSFEVDRDLTCDPNSAATLQRRV